MARIKIEDLPVLEDLSAKEQKGIFGGTTLSTSRTYEFDSSSEDGTKQGDTTFEASFEGSYELQGDSEGVPVAGAAIPGASVLDAAFKRVSGGFG